jgi:hypothetical protein
MHDDAIDVCAGRRDLVFVKSKSGSAGPGLSVTNLSLPHPHVGLGRLERRALSVTNLPTPNLGPSRPERQAPSKIDVVNLYIGLEMLKSLLVSNFNQNPL